MDYSLQIVNIETDRELRMIGETEQSSVFSKKGIRNYHLRDRYENSPLIFDVEFYRDGGVIVASERAEIERWLFHDSSFQKLYIYDGSSLQSDEDGANLYLNCRFLNPVKVEDGAGLIGYRATLEADAPLAWVDGEDSFTISGSGSSSEITVTVNSDLQEYIWPRVTVKMGSSGGDLQIVNLTDDPSRLTTFTGVTANTQIIMNGETNYISGQNYTKFSNKHFIRLRNGENTLSISGDVESISFSFKNRRFL